jgi:hypothetical protein
MYCRFILLTRPVTFNSLNLRLSENVTMIQKVMRQLMQLASVM